MALIPVNTSDVDSQYKSHHNQIGGTAPNFPVFSGSKYQRRHGLGNIFSGLMKLALPVVKQGALQLGRTALKTGLNIARDKLSGQPLGQAIKTNTKNAGRELLTKAFSRMTQPTKRKQSQLAYKSKRARVTKTRRPTARKRTRTARQTTDIFS